jgi:hypothetical protein
LLHNEVKIQQLRAEVNPPEKNRGCVLCHNPWNRPGIPGVPDSGWRWGNRNRLAPTG